jgi:hypothetical protein
MRYGGDFKLAIRFLDESRVRRDAIDTERREHERRLVAAQEATLREQAEAEAARLRRRSTLTNSALIALLGLTWVPGADFEPVAAICFSLVIVALCAKAIAVIGLPRPAESI